MNNVNFNPDFAMVNFENSIADYNKIFSHSINQTNKLFSEGADFSTVMDKIENDKNSDFFKAGAEFFEQNQIENKTPESQCEKMAQDIGHGISNSLRELSAINKQSEDDFETFASGGNISVHEVMISAQKSSLAMQMAIQLRNQALNTYNEFKNMSV